jgi:hypothetical protein
LVFHATERFEVIFSALLVSRRNVLFLGRPNVVLLGHQLQFAAELQLHHAERIDDSLQPFQELVGISAVAAALQALERLDGAIQILNRWIVSRQAVADALQVR